MKKLTLIFLIMGIGQQCFSNFTKNTASIDSMEAQAYVGKYKFERDNFQAIGEINFTNGNLFFWSEGLPKFILKPKPEKDFFITAEYEILVQFLRNEFKEVIGAKLTFQGQEFKAEKIVY